MGAASPQRSGSAPASGTTAAEASASFLAASGSRVHVDVVGERASGVAKRRGDVLRVEASDLDERRCWLSAGAPGMSTGIKSRVLSPAQVRPRLVAAYRCGVPADRGGGAFDERRATRGRDVRRGGHSGPRANRAGPRSRTRSARRARRQPGVRRRVRVPAARAGCTSPIGAALVRHCGQVLTAGHPSRYRWIAAMVAASLVAAVAARSGGLLYRPSCPSAAAG